VKKFNSGNFFEDFSVGQLITHGSPRTITEGDVSFYVALTGSQFAINTASTVAQTCGFERTPIDNLLVFHLAFGKTVPDISLNAVANLGYAECEFKQPAYTGDTLAVSSTVIGLKENSNGKSGIVYVHSVATNQNNNIVVEWKRWVMVKKKSQEITGTAAVIPDLSPCVSDIENLLPPSINLSNFESDWTGSSYFWQDYSVGEYINHIDGITINDSDHSLATRLYQNNAKVHFNQHLMESSPMKQRLVYGGHIISLCRAISYNGLGNAQWLCAINGGSHNNPSFAGDTIYCISEILDKGEIANRNDIGWLRVKSYGLKNHTAESANKPLESVSKSNIVLELDYTLLIAKR
jgi:2-methylfumaryl-CoA hydratase